MTTRFGLPVLDELMNRLNSSFLLLIACALVLCGCHTRLSTSAWEYRWITPLRQDFTKELNAAGRDGWELVSASPDANSHLMSAVLRRPKR